jgi:hypothetical protein
MTPAKKQQSCKVCGKSFQAWSQVQRFNRFCGPVCATDWAQEKALKARLMAERKSKAKARERLKTRSEWLREAQAAFNGFIRVRDYGLPCISCGSSPHQRYGGGADCGHYRSRGAAPHLALRLDNAFLQCKKCNRQLSGNIVEMRKGMINRVGIDRVLRVEHDDNPKKYTIDDLKRIKRIFRKRTRIYRKLRGL